MCMQLDRDLEEEFGRPSSEEDEWTARRRRARYNPRREYYAQLAGVQVGVVVGDVFCSAPLLLVGA